MKLLKKIKSRNSTKENRGAPSHVSQLPSIKISYKETDIIIYGLESSRVPATIILVADNIKSMFSEYNTKAINIILEKKDE